MPTGMQRLVDDDDPADFIGYKNLAILFNVSSIDRVNDL